MQANANDLIRLFNAQFRHSERTILQGGADEPFYLAKNNDALSVIYFREDFFSSALHEISHWCIAGAKRRTLDDYGYWYAPDGRTPEQQIEFEHVEVKPQALEWLFSLQCGVAFRMSVDNLSRDVDASSGFEHAVRQQLRQLLKHPGSCA